MGLLGRRQSEDREGVEAVDFGSASDNRMASPSGWACPHWQGTTRRWMLAARAPTSVATGWGFRMGGVGDFGMGFWDGALG